MEDNIPNDLAAAPAPELETTTAPVAVETESSETPSEAETKSFSQEELDAIVGKRLAREQRKWEREQAQRQAEQQTLRAPVDVPSQEYFDSPEAYADALAERKAVELLNQRETAKQQAAILDAYQAKEEDARDRYDDFEQVAYNPNLSVTDVMAQTIQASDIGPDLIYHLGSNPKEADRIARLSPFLQAKEIGKLEAALANNPPVKKTSTAPAPIAPVTARSSGTATFDTTDPRSIKSMSTSEWIEAERARQMRKAEAQRNR